MKLLSHFGTDSDHLSKFIHYGGTIEFAHKLTLGEDTDDGIYLADGTKIIDKDGNFTIVDITLTDLTATGDIALGDDAADTITTIGISQITGAITVGVDDTGHDVKFFGATSGAYLLWDESADSLLLVGGAKLNAQGEVTVGVDDTGFDVKFFGATAGSYMLWDESADALIINAGTVDCGTSCEADAYTVGGAAGIDYNAAVANITVVKGIVTAAS